MKDYCLTHGYTEFTLVRITDKIERYFCTKCTENRGGAIIHE